MLDGGIPKNSNLFFTSAIEGKSLRELENIWKEVAASEARIKLMNKLAEIKVGFNNIESFNIGLKFTSKMTKEDDNDIGKDDRKVVGAAMDFKRRDEIKNRKRWINEKLRVRRGIERNTELGTNLRRRLLRHLNMKAMKWKTELDKKYIVKVEHLRKRYQVDKVKELDKVPKEMEDMSELAVFRKESFNKLKIVKWHLCVFFW